MDDIALTLPVLDVRDYDVLVVGGGTTGSCAAIAAARGGARTAIVEYYGFLGGNAVCGLPWLGFHNDDKQWVVRGIPLEIVERCAQINGATNFHFDPICRSAVGVNGTCLKAVLAEMIMEAGIDPYLHSLAVGIKMEGPAATGVYIQNKQGLMLLQAKVIVDCTDTGDAAVMAGASYEFGRHRDSKVQVSSYIMTLTGIDFAAMIAYFEVNPHEMRPFYYGDAVMQELLQRMKSSGIFVLGAFPKLIAQAKAAGIAYDRDRLIGVAFPQWGELMLVASRVENVNPNDVSNFSQAEMTGLMQHRGIMDFVKGYMPGGQQARLSGSGHQIGIRESRHIFGDYYLTGEDLLAGTPFADAVASGNYHLDIHTPDHNGVESQQPKTYQIPYRSLLPKGTENLLIAGRCISANHEAMSSTRVIPISAAQGQAAGTAAALAVKCRLTPRQVDVKELQAQLIQAGAVIGQNIDQSFRANGSEV